jgi:oxalate---CoA ligase
MGSSLEDYLDLKRRAVEIPQDVALAAHERGPLSWADLWPQVCARAAEFAAAGIAPRSVAALALPNEPEFLSAFLAITLSAACAPLDLSLTRDEYRLYLSKINAAALVFADGLNGAVVEVARELGMRLIRIRCTTASAAGVFSVEPVGAAIPGASRRETDAAVLLHTSATTDTPKLVPLSRANLRAVAQQDFRTLQIGAADRYLSLTPLCHAHGLAASLTQLGGGGGVFCGSAFAPENLLRSIQQFRPTWISAGVPVLRILLALAREDPDAFRRSPLRFIRSTGSSPDPELMDAFQQVAGVPLLNGYGLTEVPGVTRNTPSMSRPGSAGRSSGSDLAIRNDAGEFLPEEAEGEIVVRGPALTSGYLDDPQANQKAFRDGWFHTGDIGRIDRDGFLFIAGRKKEIINRGGKKILPLEVDSVLLRHPALADAATFPIPHRTLEQEPAGAVVLRPGAKVSELELRRFAATHLAAYKVPRKIVFLDQIPRATTGKPKRAALTEQFRELGAPAHSPQLDRPATEIEEMLIAIWRRVLGLERGAERITGGDDFFDLGGDSLSAALMLTQAAAAFKLGQSQLPAADFFDHPTVSALARWIAERASETRREAALQNRILVLETRGARLPIFCFSTGEQDAYQFRHLSRWLGPEQPFTVVCPAHPVQHERLLTVEEIARQSIATIRAVRPRGPYIMGGYCYGGVVAFETARQLIAQGESVALLALFDTPTPGYPKITAAWKRYPQEASGMFSAWLRGRKPVTLREIGAHLRALTRIAAHRIGAKAPRRALPSVSQGSPGGSKSGPPEVWHPAMMRAYQPRVLMAPIVHFVGAGVSMSTQVLSDPRLGWRDFAGAEFEVRSVAGDHVSILAEAQAPALAAEFEGILLHQHAREAATFA